MIIRNISKLIYPYPTIKRYPRCSPLRKRTTYYAAGLLLSSTITPIVKSTKFLINLVQDLRTNQIPEDIGPS